MKIMFSFVKKDVFQVSYTLDIQRPLMRYNFVRQRGAQGMI